jgi:hypothetical protein
MKALYIKGEDENPRVSLDRERGIFEICGNSMPEDITSFYEPILNWFEEYTYDPLPKTILNIRLSYFNSSTSKLLLDIFMLLEEMNQKQPSVEINWYYPYYDEDMKQTGIEYSQMVDLKFNIKLEKPVSVN